MKTQFWNLFYVFLGISFSCKALNCATCKPSLTLSDRAEIFIKDTLKYPPEVKLTVFIPDDCMRIYRVLKARNSVVTRIFKYSFYKEESEIFEKAQNYLWHVTIGNCKKFFSPIRQNLIGFFLSRMKNQRLSKKRQKPLRKSFLQTCVSSF